MIHPTQLYALAAQSFCEKALAMVAKERKLNGHSIHEEQLQGLYAEYVFSRWCEDSWLTSHWVGSDKQKDGSPMQYDFILGEADRRYTVDVKCKLRSKAVNLSHCDLTVEERQEPFECDIYVAASHDKEQNQYELIGWIWKKVFWQECTRVKKGENHNGLIEKKDAGKLPAIKLRPLCELANNLAADRIKQKTY